MLDLARIHALPVVVRAVTMRALAGATMATLAACGSDIQVSERSAATESHAQSRVLAQDLMMVPPNETAGAAAGAEARPGTVAPNATSVSPTPGAPIPAPIASAQSNAMIIRTGHASIEVDSLDRALRAVQQATAAIGGAVGNATILRGEDEVRRASIELRVPAARYDSALAGLAAIGKVESVNSSAQDVGEEFVDLTARVANSRRLEVRLLSLLDNRTARLQDALAVERELSRVREEIERVEGRVRYLSARLQTSTITLALHEPLPIVRGTPGSRIFVGALEDAWRNFVNLSAAVIASLGVLLPVGLIVATAAVWWRRRRTQRLLGDLRADQHA